eukprot:UN26143
MQILKNKRKLEARAKHKKKKYQNIPLKFTKQKKSIYHKLDKDTKRNLKETSKMGQTKYNTSAKNA